MDPNSKHTKAFLIVFVALYIIGTFVFGLKVVTDAYSCLNDDLTESQIDQCLADAENGSAIFQIIFGVIQVAGIGLVIYLLLQHNKKRREMYGHNTQQNAALDQHMQQQQQVVDQHSAATPAPQKSAESTKNADSSKQ